MPTYNYQCDRCNTKAEKFFAIKDYRSSLPCPCGGRLRRIYDLETVATPGTYPMESWALGVGVGQEKEAYKHSVKIGIPTEFNERGNPVFTSRNHRKRYCEAIGFYDKDGGYGDPQKK